MLLTRRLSTALRRSAAFPRHLSTEPPAIVSGKEYRKGHQINISGVTPEEVSLFDPFQTFEETPFCKEIRSVLLNESYISPTPTQAQSWPIALHGRDMISVAKTGSGKTCGFLLPAIHKILVGPGSSSPAVTGQKPKRRVRLGGVPKLLVLAPTRELCLQINAEAEKYSRSCRLTSVSCYGGASRSFQVAALSKGADIVIGTPGRINDLLEAGVLDVSQISTLVLDEADRMYVTVVCRASCSVCLCFLLVVMLVPYQVRHGLRTTNQINYRRSSRRETELILLRHVASRCEENI